MPSSPFRDEGERQRAREAHIRAQKDMEGGPVFPTDDNLALTFDALFPPIVDAPTPPDFDAAVERLVEAAFDAGLGAVEEDYPSHQKAKQCAAAKQRVRELYEAVVRERDKWERLATAHCERAQAAESKNFNDAVALADKIDAERDKALFEMDQQLRALRAAQQGTVYEVEAFHDLRAVFLPGPYEYHPGDRVRVVKVTPANGEGG